MKQQLHRACEWTKSKQKQKQIHVTFKLTTRSIVRFSPSMVSLKDSFTVWRQSQKEDLLLFNPKWVLRPKFHLGFVELNSGYSLREVTTRDMFPSSICNL